MKLEAAQTWLEFSDIQRLHWKASVLCTHHKRRRGVSHTAESKSTWFRGFWTHLRCDCSFARGISCIQGLAQHGCFSGWRKDVGALQPVKLMGVPRNGPYIVRTQFWAAGLRFRHNSLYRDSLINVSCKYHSQWKEIPRG